MYELCSISFNKHGEAGNTITIFSSLKHNKLSINLCVDIIVNLNPR